MKIWLIGMMGSGKTSAGEIAATNLGVPFMDTDRVVEERTGMSVAGVWANEGEETFREVERSVVEDLVDAEAIVATGGGVVLHEGSRRLMVESGTVVWLDAAPSALASRVAGSSSRPLLADAEEGAEEVLEAKLSERVALYESVAHHRIDTDGLSPIEVAGKIEALWKS